MPTVLCEGAQWEQDERRAHSWHLSFHARLQHYSRVFSAYQVHVECSMCPMMPPFPLCVQLDFHPQEHGCYLTYFILQYLILVTKSTYKINLLGDTIST